MKITYILHSSFLVELEHVSMLFDYYAGQLPEIRKDRPLVVFASHFHGDHFAPVIFDLAKDREDVNYVLSKDISKKKVPDNLIGRVTFVKADDFCTSIDSNSASLLLINSIINVVISGALSGISPNIRRSSSVSSAYAHPSLLCS